MLFIIQFQEDKQETSKGDYAISGKAQAWMPPYVSTSKLSCRRRTGVSNFIFNFQRNPLTCCTSHTYPITCSNRSKTFPLSHHDTGPVGTRCLLPTRRVSQLPAGCRCRKNPIVRFPTNYRLDGRRSLLGCSDHRHPDPSQSVVGWSYMLGNGCRW